MIIRDQIPPIVMQHDPATALVRAAWRAGCPLEQFVPVLTQVVEFSRQHDVRHWLMNIDQLPPMGPQEQDWIMERWFPMMVSTPVEQLAMVLPPDLHNHIVATTPVFDPPAVVSFELHFFPDDVSAFDWLMEQKPGRDQLLEEWESEKARMRRDEPDCADMLA